MSGAPPQEVEEATAQRPQASAREAASIIIAAPLWRRGVVGRRPAGRRAALLLPAPGPALATAGRRELLRAATVDGIHRAQVAQQRRRPLGVRKARGLSHLAPRRGPGKTSAGGSGSSVYRKPRSTVPWSSDACSTITKRSEMASRPSW